MSVTVAEFWKHAIDSRLLDAQQARELSGSFQKDVDPSGATRVKTLADWLIGRKILSSYQAKVLLAGRAGPFIYGAYRVESRIKQPPLVDWFRAVHMPSGHPVLLRFLSPDVARNDQLWASIAQRVDAQRGVEHPNLQSLFALVSLQRFRFLVAEDPAGLDGAVEPLSGPLPVLDACRVIRLAALALAQLHRRGQVHGEFRPGCLCQTSRGGVFVLREWIRPLPCGDSLSQHEDTFHLLDYLAPELYQPGMLANPLTDIYALGCSLYELMVGQPPFSGGDPASKQRRHAEAPIDSLADRGVPKDIERVVTYMMEKNPSVRYQDASTVAEQLAACLEPDQLEGVSVAPIPTRDVFIKSLQISQPGSGPPTSATEAPSTERAADPNVVIDRSGPPPIATAPIVTAPLVPPGNIADTTAVPPDPTPQLVVTTDSRRDQQAVGEIVVSTSAAGVADAPAHARPQRRPARRAQTPRVRVLAAVGIVLGIAILLAGWWSLAVDESASAPRTTTESDSGASVSEGQKPGTGSGTGLVAGQEVVPDDGKRLWKSPTWGTPISFQYAPPGAQLFFVVRPAALLASDEGKRVLRSLGPEFSAARQAWETSAGVSWPQISQLIMTVHQEDLQLRAAFVVRLSDAEVAKELLQRWANPEEQQAQGKSYYRGSQWSFLLPEDDPNVFVMASETEVQGVLEFNGRAPPNGAIEKLRRVSDSEQHFTLFATPFSLTGELLRDGRVFFFGPARKIRDPLDELFPRGLDALSFSMHFGDQFYLEMRFFGRTQDRHALAADFHKRIAEIPDQIERYSARLFPHPYWRMVANRYPGMIRYMHNQMRIGVGGDEAVINGVLPSQAAHNLLFGGTMFLLAQPGVAIAGNPAAKPQGPQTVEALLATKLDLSFDQQSLEFAIRDLGQEVKDRHPVLPFAFRIQIVGTDLENDGITRNQQVRDINLTDKSLAEALTQIVVVAQATGKPASHPDQKLVWVVGPDPDQPQSQIVLVTTRIAAMKKNYELPAVFRSE